MSKYKELSNYDIEKILSKKNIRINGIFSKDLLPKKLLNGFYIVNMQNSHDGNGTHWVCFLKKNDEIFYMDSFGSPAPIEIQNHFKNYYYNDEQIQDVDSEACGYYCIAFIQYMYKKKNPTEKDYTNFVKIFKKNPKHNEIILKTLIDGKIN